MVAVTKNKKEDDILKIFISETTAPIGKKIKFHPPFLFLATVAMLIGCLDCPTQF
jgi:hypothetical protein